MSVSGRGLVGVLIVAIAWAGVFGQKANPDISLATMEAWGEPHGEWRIVKSVVGDPVAGRWLSVSEGGGTLINGDKGKTDNLLSRFKYGDCRFRIEFMIPKDSNSGIYFQDRYELQIKDSHGKAEIDLHDCGGIYQRRDRNRNPQTFEGKAPNRNASRPPGEWQSFDVVFRAPRFDGSGRKTENVRFVKVIHNGVVIHENVELSGPTQGGTEGEVAEGPIRFQGNHGPVAFRNLQIWPLKPD